MNNGPKIMISEEDIRNKVKELGNKITKDYQHINEPIVVICILKGAFIFCADLIRHINHPQEIDFLSVSSYEDNTTTCGEVKVNLASKTSLKDRYVIIVEDIIDTGLTFKFLQKYILEQKPKDLKIASFLSKPSRRKINDIKIDYLGYEIDDHFVIGYGLDYAKQYRELPYLGIML